MRKKRIIWVSTTLTVVAVSTMAVVSFTTRHDGNLSQLASNNIEALAMQEAADWVTSSKVGTIEIVTAPGHWESISNPIWGSTPWWESAKRENISCCVEANQNSACNKAAMDSRCP